MEEKLWFIESKSVICAFVESKEYNLKIKKGTSKFYIYKKIRRLTCFVE